MKIYARSGYELQFRSFHTHTHTPLCNLFYTLPPTKTDNSGQLQLTSQLHDFRTIQPMWTVFFLSFVAFISNGCYASRGKKHFFPLATHSRRIPTKLISVEKKNKKKYFSRFWLPPTAFDGKIGEIFIANEYYPCWIFTVLLFVFFRTLYVCVPNNFVWLTFFMVCEEYVCAREM